MKVIQLLVIFYQEKNYKILDSTTMKKFNVEKDSFAILNDFGYKKIEKTNINHTYLAFPS